MDQQPESSRAKHQNLNTPPSDPSHAVLIVEPKPGFGSEPNVYSGDRRPGQEENEGSKPENSVRKLPRKAKIGGSTFFISYRYLIYYGKYSIHHVVRMPDKKLFSLKIDNRDRTMVLRDETIRSKLVNVDLPKIVLSECKGSITFNVMEPFSMTFKNLIRGFSTKKENRPYNSAMLLRIGRMCIRLLKQIHDIGILHGNINPHTFVLPCKPNGQNSKPDLKRGPLIVDFSHAIDTREDPLYKEARPGKRFNSALYPEDGGIYTKRDDMENLGYLLLFLANGRIPWVARKRRDLLLFGKKCLSELERNLRGIPLVIKNYITYVRTIKWNATPDYELLDLCLTNKVFDIRAEIKARRERLRLKRKREPPVRSRCDKIGIGESDLKSPREKANGSSKRKKMHNNPTFQVNSVEEREPECFLMSLQMFPDIALKFSVPDEDDTSMRYNRTILDSFVGGKASEKEYEEGQNYETVDEFSTKSTESNTLKLYGDETFALRGGDSAPHGANDDFCYSNTNTATEQENIHTRKLWPMHASSDPHHKQTCSVQTREKQQEAIQFYFPPLAQEKEDELSHPWDDEFAP